MYDNIYAKGIEPVVSDNFQIGPDGAFEHTEPKPIFDDIIAELLRQTPLETRLKVSIEMTFIQMLVELGFIEDRPWDDDSDEDNRILKIIIDTAEKESRYLVKEVKKWKADGMSEQK